MAPVALLIVALGPFVGSFLAVLSDRQPRGKDYVFTLSSCPSCKGRLRWFELIPILSYLLQRGQCRTCGAVIPERLLWAEIAGLVLGVVAVFAAYTPLHMAVLALFLWGLLGLVLTDFVAYRLPNVLTATLLLTGFLFAAEDPDRTFFDAAIGAMTGAGSFWILRWLYQRLRGREGLGLGDIKLMGGIGAVLGYELLAVVTLGAAITALIAALVITKRTGQSLRATSVVPFGAYLAIFAGVIWFIQV
jgi:leader peptidase (prepilin peptidase)/N-methyltransferase